MREPDRNREEKAPDNRLLRPQVAEPPPQQTTFLAPTVGGAVAAASMAGRDRADEPDVSDEDAVAPGDGAA